jgi:hypothetical protein
VKRRVTQRRLVLFGGLALMLVGALLLVFWHQFLGRMTAGAWTDYLGQAERAALAEAIGDTGDWAPDDPNLRAPGLIFDPGMTSRRNGGLLTTFRASMPGATTASDLLLPVGNHWKARGLDMEVGDGFLMAANGEGVLYSAQPMRDQRGKPLLMLWRMRTDAAAGRAAKEAGGTLRYANLLPPLPESGANVEMGAFGRPGYTMLFVMHGTPSICFNVLKEDLLKRGWEPFEGVVKLGDPDGTVFQDAISLVLRHKSAPLGCQIMVSPHPREFDASHAFVALF